MILKFTALAAAGTTLVYSLTIEKNLLFDNCEFYHAELKLLHPLNNDVIEFRVPSLPECIAEVRHHLEDSGIMLSEDIENHDFSSERSTTDAFNPLLS